MFHFEAVLSSSVESWRALASDWRLAVLCLQSPVPGLRAERVMNTDTSQLQTLGAEGRTSYADCRHTLTKTHSQPCNT